MKTGHAAKNDNGRAVEEIWEEANETLKRIQMSLAEVRSAMNTPNDKDLAEQMMQNRLRALKLCTEVINGLLETRERWDAMKLRPGDTVFPEESWQDALLAVTLEFNVSAADVKEMSDELVETEDLAGDE